MRLFLALDVPEKVRQGLGDLIEEVKKQCPGARWVRPEAIHVTLKFIGHVEDAQVASIHQAVSAIRSHDPAELNFQGIGFFPNERRPRVVWCGVQASSNVAKLAADLEGALETLGIPRESRAFSPHLTLARIDPEKVRGGATARLIESAKELHNKAFGSARETEFHLYESVTKPSGAEYKRLQSFPFTKGPV